MDLFTTVTLSDIVARSESIGEYKQILLGLDDQKKAWTQIISEIMCENNYTAAQFGEMCGVSRQSVQKWINGAIPKSRSTFIKIGFAAKYNLEQMNHFLQRYGCCNGLYSKNLEDSVCIFVLSSNEIEHTYSVYENIIELIKNSLTQEDDADENTIYETSALSMELIRLQTIPELLEFIKQKTTVYKSAYHKLYAYIESFIEKNLLMDEDDNVSLLASSQNWSASLRQCVSEISQKKWYPQRYKIIFLGIHLNMNLEQINKMLNLAQMEDLCAKTPIENAIIYALENAELENRIHCDGTNELGLYVKGVLKSLDLEEFEVYMDELPDDEKLDM